MEFKIVIDENEVAISYLTNEECLANREEILVDNFNTKDKTTEEICEEIKKYLISLLTND